MFDFGNEKVVSLLKDKFVPVAVAIGTHGPAKDLEGELYKKLVEQRSTESFQGYYVFDTACRVLQHEGGSRHDGEAVAAMLEKTLGDFVPNKKPISRKLLPKDERMFPSPPENGLIIEVTSKMLEGFPDTVELDEKSSVKTLPKLDFKFAVFNQSLGRDRLWILEEEANALAEGTFPETLQTRLTRFHLVDNTRCFPIFWELSEIKKTSFELENGVLRGRVELQNAAGDRGYNADIYGVIETKDGKVTKFDMVANGDHWGGKAKGSHHPPKGKFPVAIGFTLSDRADPFDEMPPAGIPEKGYFE